MGTQYSSIHGKNKIKVDINKSTEAKAEELVARLKERERIGNKKKYTQTIKYSQLKETFKINSVLDGNRNERYMTYESFNSILYFIFQFDIPILCHTYLSKRIFEIMGDIHSNKVYEDEFLEAMKQLLSSSSFSYEFKTRALFDAMKFNLISKNETQYNTIDFIEIFDFFLNSWKEGFQILYKLLNEISSDEHNIFIASQGQLDYLIKKYEDNLKFYLIDSFKEFRLNLSEGIPYEIFKKWIIKDHDLEIIYHNRRMKVAVTLQCLDDIGIVYN